MHNLTVKIGPRFFSCAFRDYRDWRWAVAREAAQNSLDAPGSDRIDVTVTSDGANTILTWRNNGAPMDRAILCDKLLALGESGKEFNGTVGGYGRAKEVLYLCHLGWKIRTGTLMADGVGGDYVLTEDLEYFHGTESTVTVEGDLCDRLTAEFKRFISLSQWHGTFTVNGEVIEERLKKGNRRKELDFGVVYTNKSHENLLVVRINSMPMFTRHVDYKGCVILELNGKSSDVLQSSRDSLKWEYGYQLDDFVVELSVNKRSALRDTVPVTEKTRFQGYKLSGRRAVSSNVVAALETRLGHEEAKRMAVRVQAGEVTGEDVPTIAAGGKDYPIDTQEGHVAAAILGMVRSIRDEDRPSHREIPMRPEFILKNETGLKVPAFYTPEKFGQYAKSLIWRWMGVLVTLADIYEAQEPFSVGFLFTDEPVEAQHEYDPYDGHVLYLKPAEVVRVDGKAPVFKTKWSLVGGVIWDLVSIAAHEFVHYHWKISRHDEIFSSRLTEVTAVCLRERTKLAKAFQTRIQWPDV